MIEGIKQKEATAIINSLVGGVVPKIGVQHITVGRSKEIEALVSTLTDVKNEQSVVKFWIGDYGSGKSFMLHLINTIALKQKFVVSTTDFTPEKRLYSNNWKSVSLYSSIIDNLSIQTKPEGGALQTLLEKWIEQVLIQTSKEVNIAIQDIRNEKNISLIQNKIIYTINQISGVGGFDFGMAVLKYYEGYIKDDDSLKRNSLKWLKGEYRTKTEARIDLGVREIINDQNYYDMLKNFCKLFVEIGYSGLVINLDEAVNLYKISTSVMREKNYEKLLSIYNDCLQSRINNLFINIAGTKEFLENERRGLYCYNALKSRLEINKYETSNYRDFSQPVVLLLPLSHDEIFVLLKKLKSIFDFNYKSTIDISDDDIKNFMEEIFNKPGASEFLTPREVIRDFLNILNILRQNPDYDKNQLFSGLEIIDERPSADTLEDIEEL